MMKSACVAAALALAALIAVPAAAAPQETVLYSFKGGKDGNRPDAGLIMDTSGALYGTTSEGGTDGTVFKLTPPAAGQTVWTESVLYRFKGGRDGKFPNGSLIMDTSGALYGTTTDGGTGCPGFECGTVFELTPPGAGEAEWTESVLYSFKGGKDGKAPLAGLIMDTSGAFYGTTEGAGIGRCSFSGGRGCGTVFELTPPGAGETGWTESVLYHFKGGRNGKFPSGGLIMDTSGALYGTTTFGGTGKGTVFMLTPPGAGETEWTESVLYRFQGGQDGASPAAGLITDTSGALYGTTLNGGTGCRSLGGCGTVFRLVP
jgi:hypothetical protein